MTNPSLPDHTGLVERLSEAAAEWREDGILDLANLLDAAATRVKDLSEERSLLRSTLVKAGNNAGGYLSDEVTTEFLMNVPTEVHLVVERLRSENERLTREAFEYEKTSIKFAEDANHLEASLQQMRKALEENPVTTFHINPMGGENIRVEGQDRFAFEADVQALLKAIRAALSTITEEKQ